MNGRSDLSRLDPEVVQAVVVFLREWLPERARTTYREMITSDPANWSRHPHFAGGVIPEHALRGNGLTEEVLGVPDLDTVWPELLRRAVMLDEAFTES